MKKKESKENKKSIEKKEYSRPEIKKHGSLEKTKAAANSSLRW